jgi:hypothetical protein
MGWQLGLERAEELFIENLNSLVRDYLGALRYQRLVKEKRAREVKVIEVKKKEIVSQSEIVFNPTSYRLSDRGGLRSGAKERANENDLLIEK